MRGPFCIAIVNFIEANHATEYNRIPWSSSADFTLLSHAIILRVNSLCFKSFISVFIHFIVYKSHRCLAFCCQPGPTRFNSLFHWTCQPYVSEQIYGLLAAAWMKRWVHHGFDRNEAVYSLKSTLQLNHHNQPINHLINQSINQSITTIIVRVRTNRVHTRTRAHTHIP